MGRPWLGVSKHKYRRMPHAEARPQSLWWYVNRAPADRNKVIETYLARYAKGAAIPEGLHDELMTCLMELAQIRTLAEWGKPRTKRYWTIPAYARTNGIRPYTLMKRLRELEKVAIELFPARADAHGRRSLAVEPLSEKEIKAMRAKCLDGVDVEDLAVQHRIARNHVARLCKNEILERRARRAEGIEAERESAPAKWDDKEFF